MIDLHFHSTFSDGSFTPEELAEKVQAIDLKAVALTDHDTTAGSERFKNALADSEIEVISGVELSVEPPDEDSKMTIHMLGYFIDNKNVALQEALEEVRDGRESRNKKIIQKLNNLGFDITYEEVAAYAGEDVVGRPHFARALIARKIVGHKQRAFENYLGKGKPAYVERFRLTAADSIRLIREAGGLPVLAHPITLRLGYNKLYDFVSSLKDLGLVGIEVYYSEHKSKHIRDYLKIADKLGLIATGGSDFHGEGNDILHLGVGFGNLHVPDSVVDNLKSSLKV
jgi:predicted metal-dependent phosphoesterase TrpH